MILMKGNYSEIKAKASIILSEYKSKTIYMFCGQTIKK